MSFIASDSEAMECASVMLYINAVLRNISNCAPEEKCEMWSNISSFKKSFSQITYILKFAKLQNLDLGLIKTTKKLNRNLQPIFSVSSKKNYGTIFDLKWNETSVILQGRKPIFNHMWYLFEMFGSNLKVYMIWS